MNDNDRHGCRKPGKHFENEMKKYGSLYSNNILQTASIHARLLS